MKKKILVWLLGLSILGVFTVGEKVDAAEMLRLYNPNSGEHFYTADGTEKNQLASAGWQYEGTGWVAPDNGDPVYRVYNPNVGDHHYTLNVSEKDHLISVGWQYEGIGWYSDTQETVAVYRAYNPNAQTGSHNYTTNTGEQQSLLSAGWHDENIGWYAIGEGRPIVNPSTPGNSNNSGVYVDAQGNGLIKGSQNNIYHIPGSKYYDRTTNVVAWFKTIAEAEAAGYRAPQN
ncbi:calcium-binding protein [Enterococcus sp. ALS3]|uniref:Calcium-binding protein n=1 Tax=Enterococcus alishanensis TaxID=1303817 RepID=A0ABS6T9U5_9ENTE|nr:calcium-binding protein [Enterococcus alishanensis]MBV7389672.1 calcium-binding protein [Enterococcus alishanensis]